MTRDQQKNYLKKKKIRNDNTQKNQSQNMSEEDKQKLKKYKKQHRQNMFEEDKQKNKEYMKLRLKKYTKVRSNNVLKTVKVGVVTNSINDEKDDIDYPPFVDDDHDPLDGSPLGFR